MTRPMRARPCTLTTRGVGLRPSLDPRPGLAEVPHEGVAVADHYGVLVHQNVDGTHHDRGVDGDLLTGRDRLTQIQHDAAHQGERLVLRSHLPRTASPGGRHHRERALMGRADHDGAGSRDSERPATAPRSAAGPGRRCAARRDPSARLSAHAVRLLAAPVVVAHRRPEARAAAGDPGVGNHRQMTADWPKVQAALQTQ